MPQHIHVEISTLCNLDCRYCVLRANMSPKTWMCLEEFRKLLPSLRNTRSVSLSGLAEPLVNRDIVSIIRSIKRANPVCHVSIFTNAMLLTEDVSRALVDAGLDQLYFSLDGVDAASVDSMRQKGSLKVILNNIRVLQEVKKERESTMPVVAATMVLHGGNYHQLPDVVTLAGEVGARRLDVNGLEAYTDEMVPLVLWNFPHTPVDLSEVLQEAVERADAAGIELGLASLVPAPPECRQPEVPMILANGDVTACAVLAYHRNYYFTIDSNLGIHETQGQSDQRIFGNVIKSNLPSIWNQPDYVAFRRDVQQGNFPPECRHCLIKHQHICVRANHPPKAVVEAFRERQFRFQAKDANQSKTANSEAI